MLLENRIAIITGGAKGMGRAIAYKFAEEGCSIVIADISTKEANETLDGIIERGREGLAVNCDVSNISQVRQMVEKTIKKFGKIDILVNDAGGSVGPGSVEDMSEEIWDKTLALNLKSDFLCCQAVVPHMKEKGYGKIINVSSLGAIYPPTHAVSYHSAKAGILGLTYDLATALAPFNIRVNAIMPGPTWTDFIRKSIKSPEAQALAVSSMGKRVPLQRVGEPEDIAGPALFFASPLSDFVTGAALPVAGGLPFESRFIQELVFKTGDKKA